MTPRALKTNSIATIHLKDKQKGSLRKVGTISEESYTVNKSSTQNANLSSLFKLNMCHTFLYCLKWWFWTYFWWALPRRKHRFTRLSPFKIQNYDPLKKEISRDITKVTFVKFSGRKRIQGFWKSLSLKVSPIAHQASLPFWTTSNNRISRK